MLKRIMSAVDIKANIQQVLNRMDMACQRSSKAIDANSKPLLVAVSKTKPVEMIIDAYAAGQRHFGENYVQELVEKSQHPDILQKCPDIKWHFIGHLQSNKINKIIKLPNLFMIQTVDGEKLANALNKAKANLSDEEGSSKGPLKILIQINTSGEEAKNGVEPSEAVKLYQYIRENLSELDLNGIMTIGAFGHDYTTGPNPDFVRMQQVQQQICKEIQLKQNNIQVSMGMSDDFEQAIEMGSTIVRVGSSIFGHRASTVNA